MDVNEDLINTYQQIRDYPELVISNLSKLKNTEEEYYRIRSSQPRTNHTRAAKFIYLNKTSFNGIYRVNSKGIYNVPYGYRKNIDIVDRTNLLGISKALRGTEILCQDFQASINNVKEEDLVFLDPPYTVAHENNGFIAYNQKLFTLEDQYRLRDLIKIINERKAYFILTNACHPKIKELYQDVGAISKVSRYSRVGGRNKTRGIVNEYIITNC